MKLFTRLFLTATLLMSVLTITGQTENNPQQDPQQDPAMAYNKMISTLVLHINESFDLTRNLVYMNDLSSDQAYCVWADAGLPDLCAGSPQASNPYVLNCWLQLFECIDICNQFLDNFSGDDESMKSLLAEARFLRALYYSYAIDLWGDVPLRTSYAETPNPQETRTPRSEVFNFLVSELTDVATVLPAASVTNYGHPTRGAALLLLARLYLNSEVYTGQARWAEAKEMATAVINGGYTLCSDYSRLFMGDNDSNGAQQEIVLPVSVNSSYMAYWGNTTFLIASTYDYTMPDCGLNQYWGGVVLRSSMLRAFGLDGIPYLNTVAEAQQAAGDERCMIQCNGKAELGANFSNGIHCLKYSNLRTDDTTPSDPSHADTDFPLMRLAEAYLIAAEADARLNGGVCTANGLQLLNMLRTRAKAGNLNSADLGVICDEWAREFYLEGQRRSQLIRFGYYSNANYLWDGKGNTVGNLMPVPNNIIREYPNYVQNPGYEDFSVKPEGMTMNTPAFADLTVDLKKFQALQFSWTRPTNFNDSDELTYDVQIATDAAFNNSFSIDGLSQTNIQLSAQSLYNYLGGMGIGDGETVVLYVRVVCHGVATDAISFSVVRSNVMIQPKTWFLTGFDIADGSWANSVNAVGTGMVPMFISQVYNNGYASLTYTDYFGGNGFKGVATPGDWNNQVGEINGQYYFNEGSSANIILNGYYTIALYPQESFLLVQPLDFTPMEYSSIGIIGSFNGWGSDLEMTRTSATSHTWYAQVTFEESTELKFRANGSWDINWGEQAFPYGQSVTNGANISVKAGTWKVFFNDIDGRYLFMDAETAQLPGSIDSENTVDGLYLNKEFATITATAADPIDVSKDANVKVANIQAGEYLALYLVVGNHSYYLESPDYTYLATSLKYLADFAADKTQKVENGVKTTTFSAKLRGYVTKQDLTVFTESEPFVITLIEQQQPLTVEDDYFYIGGCNGWDMTDQGSPLIREGNMVFSYTWTLPANVEDWFCIAPASAYTSNNFWGSLVRPTYNGASTGTGAFVVPSADGAWCIPASEVEKTYCMVIDFSTMTYTLSDVVATGIVEIHNSQFAIHNEATAPVYDLNGRALKGQLKQGLYIRGGRKVVVSK